MALKYYAYFNSTAWAGVTSTRYKIEIYDTTFSGTATEVTTGANPFSEKELNNEETTYGIKSCRFDIDIVSDVVTVEDFYTQEGMSHRVKLYEAPLVGDMTLIRDGYLLSEDVQEVYQDGIKVIQLSGTDGLELLKTIPFEFSAGKPYTGVMTALLLLDRCITPIGLELNVNTSFNYYQDGQSKIASFEPLAFFNVHAPLFKGKTCYEALSMLCETLRCVIFQEDGEWWFVHTLNPDSTTQYYRKWDSDFNSLSSGTLPSAITVEFEGEYAPCNDPKKLKKRSFKSVTTDVDIQDYINKLRNPDFTSGITEWVDGGVDSYASGGDGTNLNPYYLQINGYQNKTALDFLNIKYVSQNVATLYDVTTDDSISGKLDTSIKVSGKVLGNGVKFGNVGLFLRIETDSPLAPNLILCLSDSGEWIHLGLTQTAGLSGVLDVISGIKFNILKNIISIPLTDSDGVQIDDWKGFEIESKNISEIVLNMNKSIGFIDNIIGGALEQFYQIDVEDFTKVELYMVIYEGYDNTVGSSDPRNIKYGNLNLEIKDKSRLVGLKKDRYFSEQSNSAPNKLEVNAYFSDFQDNTQLISMLQSDEVTPTILWEDSSGNNVGELMMGLNRELLSLYYKPTSLYDGDILGKVKKYHKINLVEFANELINLNWNFDFGEGIATGVRYIMTFANYGTFTNTKYGIYSDDKQIKYDGNYPTGIYEFDQVPALKPDLIARNLLEIKASSLFSDGYATFSKINPKSGIQWFDAANNKTDYFLTTEDGFVMKSETNPYEVTLDFTELTANTKLIIPPLSADAYLLTSENGWVLEGNNISTAKKLGSTTAQDWIIIHTNNTIATVNSSGINLGENLLSAGGVQFDLTPTQTGAVGKLMWNDTDGTLEFGMKGGNVTQQIGQELPVLVKHADNTGLANGAVVYVVGSDGSNKTVRYALANAESTSSKTFGVMTEDASGGSKGFCTTFGIVRNINTSALTEGAAVYLSPTVAGGMTTTKPSAPNHMVLVGFCIRSHATLGSIFVKIINGFELNEIHDVAIGTLANNNLLAYESATSLWKNKTYSELGLFPTPSGLTTNYVTKWNGTALANSLIFDNGSRIGISQATPLLSFEVANTTTNTYSRPSIGGRSADGTLWGYMLAPVNSGTFFDIIRSNNLGLRFATESSLGGGTFTTQMSITSVGDVIIGSAVGTNSLVVSKSITGSADASGIRSSGQVQSDVTSNAFLFRAVSNQANFVATNLINFESTVGTISGTGTNLINFRAASTSAGYTNVYGFQGTIASGTNRYNLYQSGTAQNYIRGNVGIGSGSSVPATELEVRGVVSASLGSASLPAYTFVGDVNNGWWSPAADTQAWSLSGAEVMRLNSTGLGIGVTPSYKLDVSGTGHFTGAVTFDTVPSSLQDATTSNHLVRYSQWIASTSVKYLPTAVKTVSLTNITLSGTQTVNGVALVATDRILVAGQTAGAENGVWVVAAGAWSRATDGDTDAELRGYIVSVSSGTYTGYKYINTNASAITVGTTAITYSEFSNNIEIDPVFVSWRDTTRTANTFWAAPNGSNGAATWRALVAADVPTLNQSTTGSAATLTTSRNIAISGDLTWNVDFNGSAAVTAVGTLATVNSNVGTYAGITVNGKGLVTAATALTTLSGYGITDAQSTLVSGTNIKTVGTYSLLGSGDVTLASLNYWTKSGSDVSYIGGNVYAPYFESNGAMVAFASTGTDNYTILGVGSTSFQQKVYDVTNQRLETISSAGVLGTIFNGGNYRFGTGTDSGLAKVQVVGAIQQSSVTSSYIKANASGVLIAGTITTSDVSDLSSYTGFDSRYFTETESDARFVALAGSYANPTWITSLAWSKLTSVPSSFTPSAHTLDSHSNVTITSNSNGEILKWNGSAWINNTLAEAGIQATLSGTGFVKSTAGTISYDTSTYQPLDADLTAIAGITSTSGLLKKTAANTWSLDTNTYITGNQTITLSGIVTGSGTTAITTSIADSALSIAKTSGLQTALDGKFANPSGLTTNYVSKWNGTGFSNSLFFDNGTSVGIGTVNPLRKLDVVDSTGILLRHSETVNTSGAFRIIGGSYNGNGVTGLMFGANINNNSIQYGGGTVLSEPATQHQFYVGTYGTKAVGSEVMRIANSGFVGINTTTPAYTLDVLGTIRTTSLMITSGAVVGSFLKANNVNGTSVWASITTSDISNLGTANQLLRVNSGATALEYFTPTYISANQTITLSGVITGSGTTAITTSIADATLSIAKTSGLQTALDSKMTTTSYPDLVAIEALADTSGFLKKTASNTWSLDTSTYLTANQTITLSGDVSGSGTTSITTTLATISQASSGDFKKITLDTKGRVIGNTSVVIGDLTALGATTLTSLSSTATGLTYTNTTGVFSLTSGYSIPTTANQTNWSTAYGWGNHASAGYLTTSTAASTYQPLLPSGTAGQFLIRNASNALEFSTLELEPVSLSNNKIAVGDSANYLSEYNNFEFLESRFISIYRPSDSSRALYMGMYSLSNNSFITAAGGNLTLKGDTGIYLHGFTGFGNKMVIVDGDGKLGYTDIPSGGSGSSSLTSTYIGYGSTVNTLTGNSTFTYLDNRYIHLTSSGSNFNLGTFSSAGFIESVNGNLLLQARSTYGVVVDEGYFQVDALGGGGTKMVVVDNNGKFGTQTIPSGGGVPALTATQIGFGDGSNLMTSSANFVYDATKTAIYLNDSSNYLYVGKSVSLSDMYEITAVGTRGIQLNTDMDIVIKNNNHLYLGSGASNKRVHIGRGASHNDANHYLVINGETFSFSMDNISGWGDSNSASTPQVGDKVLFNVVDVGGQKRFVPQKINKKLFSSLTSGDTVLIL